MQLHTVTAAPSNTHFLCTGALFGVLTLFFFFFAQPITFLHFYQKTSISEIWLHLLWLPPRHCVSSLNQRALTAAAAGGGGEVIDSTLWDCTHLSPSRCRFYLSASLNIQQTKRAPRELPLGCLHYIEWISEQPSSAAATHTWMIMTSGLLFLLVPVSWLAVYEGRTKPRIHLNRAASSVSPLHRCFLCLHPLHFQLPTVKKNKKQQHQRTHCHLRDAIWHLSEK